MTSAKDQKSSVKTSIPKALHMAIMRIQVAEGLDWKDACAKAANLIDLNSKEYRYAVDAGVQREYKSRFMSELNSSRSTIREQARQEGYNEAWAIDHFRVPCSICGKDMIMSSRDNNWGEQRNILFQSFHNWAHTDCQRKY